jgi:peptidyl-prolyl cis-trans isomerase A (cyclophilin A)
MRNNLMVAVLALGLGTGLTLGAGSAAAQSDDKHPVVVMDTNMGEITIELDAEKAPITVENFMKYVDAKYFDNLTFHRVIPRFMIQGGGFDATLTEKREGHRAPIRNESGNGLSNKRGTIAMARTNDPDSATSQFFINHADNNRLDSYGGGYAVFGKVTGGMDVVDKIANVETAVRVGGDGRPMEKVPVQPVIIKSVRRKAKS